MLLLMEKGETKKVRRFLEDVCERDKSGNLWIKAPDSGYSDPGDCWFNFKRNIVEIGYQMYQLSSEWATAMGCLIRDHFKVRKGGWDSIGYCDDFMTTRPFRASISIAEESLDSGLRFTGHEASIRKQVKEWKRLQILFEFYLRDMWEKWITK